MIDDIVRDIQVLAKADSMIGKIWLNVMARRFGLYAFAGLLAVLGLAMANVAALQALQQSWGPVWAAVTVAGVDLVIAGIVALLAGNIHPGPEIELAFDVRRMALEAVRANSREVKAGVESVGQQIRQTKNTIAGFVESPLDSAAEHLLIPAALSLLRGLRVKKAQG